MNMKLFTITFVGILGIIHSGFSCTGITLRAKDNSIVVARTVDWSRTEMNSMYVIAPRGHTQTSLTPSGKMDGLEFTSVYGYVGIAVESPDFVIDGTNEAGLSAGLFYFPDYGKYPRYSETRKDKSIADFELVAWMLSRFSTIEQIESAIQNITVTNIDPTASTVHWRITDATGRQVILEFVDGAAHFYDSKVGAISNSPGYPWHVTNLNNYINLRPGTLDPKKVGDLTLHSFGSDSGMLGLPGDFTPPSRFIRAALLSNYSIPQKTGYESAMKAFHILNNLDVPLGVEFDAGRATNNMPSATQWTIATDLGNKVIYYHTMYNRTIRSIDMKDIDFANVRYQYGPLDTAKVQTIIPIKVK
ncbi:MAG: choloylglycine hydrolase family protein [Alphaproteobacteria bacterium]|nr:choloylglycine hydrolase family protein [Alphaproteobacteria bacterium]